MYLPIGYIISINIGIGTNKTRVSLKDIMHIMINDMIKIIIDLNSDAKLVVNASRNKVQSVDMM